MALDDIQFLSTGSYSQPSFVITLETSGSLGSPILIEPQTVYFENRIFIEQIGIF